MQRVIFWLMTFMFLWVNRVQARLVINEMMPNPDDDNDASEWIEIYNDSAEVMELTGYSLKDASDKTYLFSTTISGKGFRVIPKSESKLGLNNDKETVILTNDKNEQIDIFEYTKTSENLVYARSPDGSANWIETEQATPGQSNGQTPTPTLTPAPTQIKVYLSEIYACPADQEEEWIEVHNGGGTGSLDGWFVQDEAQNVKALNGKIEPNAYVKFSFYSSWLNNNGDTIYLINNTGETVDQMKFSRCETGSSWIQTDNGWEETGTLTPDQANIETRITPTLAPVVTIIPINPTKIQEAKLIITLSPTKIPQNEEIDETIKEANIAATMAAILGISQPVQENKGSIPKQPKAYAIWVMMGGALITGAGLWPFIQKN